MVTPFTLFSAWLRLFPSESFFSEDVNGNLTNHGLELLEGETEAAAK